MQLTRSTGTEVGPAQGHLQVHGRAWTRSQVPDSSSHLSKYYTKTAAPMDCHLVQPRYTVHTVSVTQLTAALQGRSYPIIPISQMCKPRPRTLTELSRCLPAGECRQGWTQAGKARSRSQQCQVVSAASVTTEAAGLALPPFWLWGLGYLYLARVEGCQI